jgi:flagellar motor switch/type III secretory pathway protein FliN
MANAAPLTNAGNAPVHQEGTGVETSAPVSNGSVEQALVPMSRPEGAGPLLALESPMTRLPVELDVAVPIQEFRVRDLLALDLGRVVETRWGHGDDVPLAAGAVQLAWSEFEVIDTQLAVRITRLS